MSDSQPTHRSGALTRSIARMKELVRDTMQEAARSTPARLTLIIFSALIAIFTFLLMLPISHVAGEETSFVDALFTAMSAVCVTGLTTVDTATHWSTFGLVVLMFAMKIGGLGVLTLASLLGLSVSRHMGLAQKIITAQETKAEKLAEVGGVLRTIVITATSFELLTFLLITPNLIRRDSDLGTALFNGAFYAISAFNNAGFVPEAGGVEQYVDDPWFSIPVALAVFVGALGFPVILVVVRNLRHPKHWSLHAKLTLSTSAILFVVGFFGILAMEWSNPATLGEHSFGTKILA
ncbi:potassium transporter TrkG, partial [Dermabacteraceae bacterium P13101]